jgi:cytoskeleton protein RodZ
MSITERADERTDSSGPVGAQLRRARTDQGLSIEDVCRRTNIRPAVVHALEDGDLEPSGGAVYARGHVRTLAHALDLDADHLLANFDASYGAAMPKMPVLHPEPQAPAEPREPRAARVARPARKPRWSWIFAGALVVVIVIALVQLLLPEGSPSSQKSPKPAAPSASASAAAKAPKKLTPPAPSLVFPVPADGVTLRIVLKKASWLQVSDANGVPLVKTTVKPSAHSVDLHAQALRATFGDAGAVEVSCNGHPLGPIGVSNQVVTLIFARGNVFCPAA